MKKILYLVVVALLTTALVVGISFITTTPSPKVEEEVEAEIVKVSDAETKETRQINATSEDGFADAIHYMTHQKIYATAKWGSLEITDERIDSMLETLDKTDFVDEEFYRETLDAWKSGDFSNAVEVHNYIWEQKDGNIGQAQRLLTEEEEQAYIEANQ